MKDLKWKVNTPGLMAEILTNKQCAILFQPIRIFSFILAELSEVAIEIDNPKLNAIMFRLALYEGSLPNDKDFEKNKKHIEKELLEFIKK